AVRLARPRRRLVHARRRARLRGQLRHDEVESCYAARMGRVLVVDDEQSMREFLAICLKRGGHEVTAVDSAALALARLDKQPVDVVLTDLRMPGELDGLGLLTQIKQKGIDVEVILVTAFATADTAIAAM